MSAAIQGHASLQILQGPRSHPGSFAKCRAGTLQIARNSYCVQCAFLHIYNFNAFVDIFGFPWNTLEGNVLLQL